MLQRPAREIEVARDTIRAFDNLIEVSESAEERLAELAEQAARSRRERINRPRARDETGRARDESAKVEAGKKKPANFNPWTTNNPRLNKDGKKDEEVTRARRIYQADQVVTPPLRNPTGWYQTQYESKIMFVMCL